jgi:hypothetical protein
LALLHLREATSIEDIRLWIASNIPEKNPNDLKKSSVSSILAQHKNKTWRNPLSKSESSPTALSRVKYELIHNPRNDKYFEKQKKRFLQRLAERVGTSHDLPELEENEKLEKSAKTSRRRSGKAAFESRMPQFLGSVKKSQAKTIESDGDTLVALDEPSQTAPAIFITYEDMVAKVPFPPELSYAPPTLAPKLRPRSRKSRTTAPRSRAAAPPALDVVNIEKRRQALIADYVSKQSINHTGGFEDWRPGLYPPPSYIAMAASILTNMANGT